MAEWMRVYFFCYSNLSIFKPCPNRIFLNANIALISHWICNNSSICDRLGVAFFHYIFFRPCRRMKSADHPLSVNASLTPHPRVTLFFFISDVRWARIKVVGGFEWHASSKKQRTRVCVFSSCRDRRKTILKTRSRKARPKKKFHKEIWAKNRYQKKCVLITIYFRICFLLVLYFFNASTFFIGPFFTCAIRNEEKKYWHATMVNRSWLNAEGLESTSD